MLENKDYCDYDTCVALRKLGFNDSTYFYYKNNGEYVACHAYWRPELIQKFSLYEAQKWLREEKNIYVHICRPHMTNGSYVWSNEVVFCGCGVSSRGFFLSYEEALSEGIKEAVKILKENGYGKGSNTCQ